MINKELIRGHLVKMIKTLGVPPEGTTHVGFDEIMGSKWLQGAGEQHVFYWDNNILKWRTAGSLDIEWYYELPSGIDYELLSCLGH